jgi:CBS domain-containing protein
MKASEIMTRNVVTVHPAIPVREAIALLAEHCITSMPVLDDDHNIIGIVSELDLLRERMPHDPRAHLRPEQDNRPDPARTVRDVMSDVVICAPENADSADLAELLVDNRVRALPVLRGGDLVGIVSRRDLLRILLRDDSAIRAEVQERLDAYAGESGRWRVDVDAGVVTVHGHFDDDRQRQIIDVLTRTVPAVVRVHLEATHPLLFGR